jgi:c-di-GMP-binding flagellar brake protein YcgR
MTTSASWPELNAHVDLAVDWWPGPLASRIEDRRGDDLVVAGPTTPGVRPIPAPTGADVRISWLTERGPATVPGVVTDTRPGDHPTWTVRATGAVEVQQRRSYARVAIAEAIVLTSDVADHPATMVDLSEGGLSAVVFATTGLASGRVLHAVVDVGGDPLAVTAEVVRHRSIDRSRLFLALRFRGLDPRDADRIRRHVFDLERRRRAGAS